MSESEFEGTPRVRVNINAIQDDGDVITPIDLAVSAYPPDPDEGLGIGVGLDMVIRSKTRPDAQSMMISLSEARRMRDALDQSIAYFEQRVYEQTPEQ